MSDTRRAARRRPFLLLVLVLVLVAGAGTAAWRLLLQGEEKDARAVAVDAFLDAWASGDAPAAGRATSDPARATARLTAHAKDLPGARFELRRGERDGGRSSGRDGDLYPFRVTLHLKGGDRFTYDSVAPLVRTGDDWRVAWSPAVVHPRLTDGSKLAATTESRRAEILSADGTPLDGLAPALVGAPGTSGLHYRYEKQLAGRAASGVAIVGTSTGRTLATLHTSKGDGGSPVRTTLDKSTQKAAEAALRGLSKNAAIVAVRPSTGEIVAAADNPPTGENRALRGQYPPGSDFKVVTAAALIGGGMSTSTPTPCPKYVTVNGQRFENQDLFELPEGATFADDFAHSCNTGIIAQRDRLTPSSLTDTAKAFGIGQSWDVGAVTFDGSVPVATSANDQAAAMIGQGRVQASPLVMASVAATVKDGTFRQPVLVPAAVKQRAKAPVRLEPPVASQLRTLMRAVVTEGSGKALRGMSGEPGAKTGTAEYGDATPPRTHAWFIGYRGDLAFAVLIEDGGSGGKDAGPVAAAFLKGVEERR
ncbi:penicillin-binding transpeptidase domain-containing protein [Streptomyces sp. NBC_00237]|uniref:penicillin-binding transpeptidase domain-containing protein n=1 Tax=Streptomyces sp. NBC_00237 TaxID=2975687 RepID=UPI00225902BE|nr:penicillin-binding transpeptidase domain-containing protein [Streptomyces sp. NBC_00237]MCX5205435.1 penicillin-binding transpeptidase domain-containing protein [Streptomyces sp. NBC_00237]